MGTVAIVDDEFGTLVSLRFAFEAERHLVETYSNPVVALPKLILVPPSVLILNGLMPLMHGVDFFRKFRQFSSAPVIFLSESANAIEKHLEKNGMPADAYVSKPFSVRDLVKVADRFMSRPRRLQVP